MSDQVRLKQSLVGIHVNIAAGSILDRERAEELGIADNPAYCEPYEPAASTDGRRDGRRTATRRPPERAVPEPPAPASEPIQDPPPVLDPKQEGGDDASGDGSDTSDDSPAGEDAPNPDE